MTGVAKLTGATPSLGKHWEAINWQKVERMVKRLQMRIAKAVREGNKNKVKALQWILSHSFYAKLLAVMKVTSNKGAKTPGVDKEIWNTPAKKMRGALSLNKKNYKALPLRRIMIPKKNGKKRPLGIPIIRDRAMQALYLLTLEPISETTADPNSYGFRVYRSCKDAISQCFICLAKKTSAKWILDADIKACFDEIEHEWMMKNIPVDKYMLKQWLKCGYYKDRRLFPTNAGTPQGGILSPTLANMTLDGMEQVIKRSCPKKSKVNFIRYADDVRVTADSRELIENNIIPAINKFLKPRGLELSEEKTRIVHIEDGFDFLGQNLRKYKNKLITTPSKANTKNFISKVRKTIKENKQSKADVLIRKLNPIIRGWAYYHKYIQATSTYTYAERIIFDSLWRWIDRRHPGKSKTWKIKRYFNHPTKNWTFCQKIKDKKGKETLIVLIKPRNIRLVRNIKIRAESNPYDPEYREYFEEREIYGNEFPIS